MYADIKNPLIVQSYWTQYTVLYRGCMYLVNNYEERTSLGYNANTLVIQPNYCQYHQPKADETVSND